MMSSDLTSRATQIAPSPNMELGEHVDIGCNEAKLNIVFHSPFFKIKQSTFYVLIFTKKYLH